MNQLVAPVFMRTLCALLFLFVSSLSFSQETAYTTSADTSAMGVLVFHKSDGYYHESIPEGLRALEGICRRRHISYFATNDASVFNSAQLRKFKAMVFLNTTGNVLNDEQQAAMVAFMKGGGNFMGIHSAADTESGWPWYVSMLGATFNGHPAIQEAKIVVVDRGTPASRMLSRFWFRKDEWYNYKTISPSIRVIARLDETSYSGGKHGRNHPIAWFHKFEGSRVFYTGGGHTTESYQEPMFLSHLEGGLMYVLNIADL